MKPTLIFKAIKEDPTFLLRDYVKDFFILSSLIVLLFLVTGKIEYDFSTFHIAALILAIPFGWLIAAFLHKSGHGNVGHGPLNRIIGEFVGNFVGYGFNNFIMVHTLHHLYSDHKYDPVSPRGMTFTKYLVSPNKYMIKHTKEYLRDTHTETENYEHILRAQTIVFHANVLLRLVAWFLIFGPALFVCFYLPAVLSNITILAHINYVCHRDHEDGSVEVFNMDHNFYYKLANFVTMGGYYHKNHHEHLSLFDPRTAKDKKRRLLTIKSNTDSPVVELSSPSASSFSLKGYFNLDKVWEEKDSYISR